MSVSFVISCTIGQSAYPSRRFCHLTVCELHFTTKLGTGDGAAFASDVFFSFVLLSAKKKKKNHHRAAAIRRVCVGHLHSAFFLCKPVPDENERRDCKKSIREVCHQRKCGPVKKKKRKGLLEEEK